MYIVGCMVIDIPIYAWSSISRMIISNELNRREPVNFIRFLAILNIKRKKEMTNELNIN